MKYAIFIVFWLIALWAYHRIKYRKSGYGKFEYYLQGEVEFLSGVILLTEIFICIAILVGMVYLGGQLIGIILNQST